jgi:hypothetical protein
VNVAVAGRAREAALLLLEQLTSEIRAEDWKDPCIITVMPGSAVAFDYCNQCDQGMAWTRVAEVVPVVSAQQTTPGVSCASAWEATVELGMIRGAKLPAESPLGDDWVLPDAVEQWMMADQQFEEMGVMYRAVCNVEFEKATGPATATSYSPVGPEGGCIGGVWLVTVGLI